MRSVATAIGMGKGSGNLSTALNANNLSAERVIEIALELDVDIVNALHETGYIPEGRDESKLSKEELIARIERLITYLKREIAQEEAEIIPLKTRQNQPQSDTMFENMVADSSPDEDEQRLGDESNY